MSKAAGAEAGHVVSWRREMRSRVRRWPQFYEFRSICDSREKIKDSDWKSERKM